MMEPKVMVGSKPVSLVEAMGMVAPHLEDLDNHKKRRVYEIYTRKILTGEPHPKFGMEEMEIRDGGIVVEVLFFSEEEEEQIIQFYKNE